MNHGGLGLTFFLAAAILGAAGFALYAKFKDKPGQTSFGLSPRGLLGYGGIILMIAGAIAAAVAVKIVSR